MAMDIYHLTHQVLATCSTYKVKSCFDEHCPAVLNFLVHLGLQTVHCLGFGHLLHVLKRFLKFQRTED